MHEVVFPGAHQLAELEYALGVRAGRDLAVDLDLVDGVPAVAQLGDARIGRAGRLDRQPATPQVVDLRQEQGLESKSHRADVEHLHDAPKSSSPPGERAQTVVG